MPRPSDEVLAALVVSLREELIVTRTELERALTRIAELEARLATNSGNSSKPPSSDGLAKPAPKPRSLRKKTDRKPGGQPGHDGTTLRQVAKPRHEVVHEPGPCTGCGCSLSGRPITAVERRQQFDLPPICVEVTEHQLVERECVCGQRTRGEAPPGVDAPVQYGRTDKYTLLTCHPKRGTRGIDDLRVLPRFRGVAIHDAWAPYDTYLDPQHQLCCAHALRELQAVAETAPTGEWCWATQAADAMVAMQILVNEAAAGGRDSVEEPALAEQVRRYRSAAGIGIHGTAARTGKLMKKHNALAHRLLDRQDDYLRFTHDWRIPPDNNGSERDIRMIKLRQKVSGCQRTLTGAKQFCAIRSYRSTAAKHGMQFFEALVALTHGQPWMPATT